MSAVWLRVRSGWRRGAVGFIALALLVGLSSGACLAAIAAGRRTHSAVDRFERYFGAGDAGVGLDAPNVGIDPSTLEEIQRLPEVTTAALATRLLTFPDGDDGNSSVIALGAVARGVDPVRPIVVAGRLADPADPTEAMIDESTLQTSSVHLGSSVTLRSFAPDQVGAVFSGGEETVPSGPTIEVHVVGVIRSPADLTVLPPTADVFWLGDNDLFVTQAALDRYGADVGRFGPYLEVQLEDGLKSVPAFEDDVRRIAGDEVFVYTETDVQTIANEAKRATNLEATALWLLGACLAIGVLVVAGQALARSALADVADGSALQALGFGRAQLLAVSALRGLVTGVAAAVVAIAVAIAVSPLAPIGLARKAEVDRGVSVDAAVLGFGALAVVIFAVGRSTLASFRALRARSRPSTATRPGLLPRLLVGSGLASAPASAGLALGHEGPAAAGASRRIATVGATAAILAVSGAMTFGTSLDRFVDDPPVQGWNWDALVGNPHSSDLTDAVRPSLTGEPFVQHVSGVALGSLVMPDGREFGLVGIDDPTVVPLLSGRAPHAADEIALGGKELRREGLGIGDNLHLTRDDGSEVVFRIVGEVVVSPYLVNTQAGLGDSSVVTMEGLQRVAPETPVNQFIVRFRDGTDQNSAVARLKRDFVGEVLTAERPPDVVNLARVSGLPDVLAVLLGLVGAATVVHGLLSLTRRGRNELAVLKSIGFERRQLVGAIAAQTSALGVTALAVGLPLGIAAGRFGWTRIGHTFAVSETTSIPGVRLAAVVAIAIAVLVAAAVGPAAVAARTRAATLLRAD